MEKLIPLINKLQEVFSRTKLQNQINLPQIVVVGGQSSGKSSVLESIVGLDFLPRGSNIVTRRPTVIQLYHTNYSDKEWAEFSHRPNEKYFDFQKVKEEIEMDTERICGKGKDISATPIILKIYSKSVVDLTMVDLPGITKIPTGDQPHDIEKKIVDLCMKYISPKQAIIMAVCAANQDLANSDGLKLARRVDPLGERTLGVLTKIDIMDEGTNAIDLLSGKIYPLKLGYVGVVCRSQKDILQGKSIQDALKAEEKFFKTSPNYFSMAQRLGVPYLSHQLNQIIVNHIKKCLPEMRSQITALLFQKEKELRSMQLFKDDTSNESQLILNVIAKFASQYSEYVEGKFVKETASELMGGSRLSYIFYEVYNKSLNNVDPFDNLSDEDLRTAIRNASSLKPNLFVPEAAFEVLSKQQIVRLESPSLQCVQLVYEELRRIIVEIDMPELKRFQNLRKKIVEVMYTLLTKCLQPTNEMVKNLVQIEDSYINTHHPDFMGGATAMLNVFDPNNYKNRHDMEYDRKLSFEDVPHNSLDNFKNKASSAVSGKVNNPGLFSSWFGGNPASVAIEENVDGINFNDQPVPQYRNDNDYEINKYINKNHSPVALPLMPTSIRNADKEGESSPRSAMEIRIIKNLIISYFNIVRKNLNDMVPKTIIAFLVNKTKNQAQRELVGQIYSGELDLKKLLVEDQATVRKRETVEDMVTSLKKSLESLSEVRDFYFEDAPFGF